MRRFSALRRVWSRTASSRRSTTAASAPQKPLARSGGDQSPPPIASPATSLELVAPRCSQALLARPALPKSLTEPVKAGAVEASKASTKPSSSVSSADNRGGCYIPKKTAPKAACEGLAFTVKPGGLEEFTPLRTIGTGSFGRVFVALTQDDEHVVAIKKLNKAQIVRQKQVAHVLSEKDILKQIRHPFLVRMYGTFQDEKSLYIVLDYVEGGELFFHLRKQKRLNERAAMFYGAQVVTIFEYLHRRKIVYRDLKPENLLIARDGYLRLTDFGFAKVLTDGRTFTLCGTPEYIAPEVLKNKGHGLSVDWWTLGILIYEMLSGYPPYYDEDPMGIYTKILAGKLVFPKFIDNRSVKSLVRHLLDPDISQRYGRLTSAGLSDVRFHRWFKDSGSSLDFNDLLARRIIPPYKPEVSSAMDCTNFNEYPSEPAEKELRYSPPKGEPDPFIGW